MKLIDLIPYLRDTSKFTELYKKNKLNTESEAISIYMKEKLSIDSDIVLFEIEETEDKILFKKNDIQYVYLLEITLALELFENLVRIGFIEGSLIAQRILDYGINDA